MQKTITVLAKENNVVVIADEGTKTLAIGDTSTTNIGGDSESGIAPAYAIYTEVIPAQQDPDAYSQSITQSLRVCSVLDKAIRSLEDAQTITGAELRALIAAALNPGSEATS